MKREPKFTPIDLRTWNRGELFWYFSQMAPTGYSMTVDLDVTHMKECLDRTDWKFFPAYLWLVTKVLNEQVEFRIAQKDGRVGYYDYLTPLYAHFHEEEKTFSLMWTEFQDQIDDFYRAYLENQRRFGQNKGVLSQVGQLPPPNAYTVSCVPWIHFNHFSVHSYESKSYYFPSVEAGKFREKNGRLMMPLSITCHHAAADGYHVSVFLDKLQKEANSFEKYV